MVSLRGFLKANIKYSCFQPFLLDLTFENDKICIQIRLQTLTLDKRCIFFILTSILRRRRNGFAYFMVQLNSKKLETEVNFSYSNEFLFWYAHFQKMSTIQNHITFNSLYLYVCIYDDSSDSSLISYNYEIRYKSSNSFKIYEVENGNIQY